MNQVKNGMTVVIADDVFVVVDAQHVKPGRGNAFLRTKLKNLKTSQTLEKTFRGEEKIEEAFIEQKKIQFSYRSQETYHFLDMQTYEELTLTDEQLDSSRKFIKDNLELVAYFFNKELINVSLPNFIEYKVLSTEIGFRGDTVKPGSKPAQLENELSIQVPLFIQAGDTIKVDTRTGEYMERISRPS